MEFIPIAEESGLITGLGRCVLEQSLAAVAQWRAGNFDVQRISVNVSARQLADDDLAALCADLLNRHGLTPDVLELELTEGVLIDASEHTRRKLIDLVDLGISLAIDDFGTGYSSLAYLSRFPFQVLKIDRSFVRDLPGNRESETIVRHTIALARDLGKVVVAEGVENQAQVEWLLQHGVDELQGFHFAAPLAQDEFERWCYSYIPAPLATSIPKSTKNPSNRRPGAL